jgi:hypothetical protein
MNKAIHLKATLAIFLVAASSPLVAATITVVNSGFNGVYSDAGLTTLTTLASPTGFAATSSLESPTTSFGFSSSSVYVSGWTSNAPFDSYTGGVGWNDTYGASPSFGFLNGSNRTMSQTLGATLAEGTYTLTFGAAKYQDARPFGLSASLLAGTSAITPSESFTPTPLDGTLLNWSYTFNVDSSNLNLGQTLSLKFSTVGDSAPKFDNVSLDFAAIPEPSSLALAALGFGAVLLRMRSGSRRS